ncbi:hypothetical protein DPMN_097977 [Dreissena polymorpha]|uniref:Uncharacterized protein n=1 Tax=Dreissena polymorpha TaxID=45954 RepID=A0A9D4LB97_DREPO|nr:hypothetical protein DPMN_097977 [Dreissena polymorpha]
MTLVRGRAEYHVYEPDAEHEMQACERVLNNRAGRLKTFCDHATKLGTGTGNVKLGWTKHYTGIEQRTVCVCVLNKITLDIKD